MEGVPEQCESYYRWHQEVYGAPPGRNAMQRELRLSGLSEHAIRTGWETLSGKRRAPRRYRPKQKETGMEQRDIETTDTLSYDTLLEQFPLMKAAERQREQDQQARMAALEQQVADLRALVMALPSPKPVPLPAELAQAVGRLQAAGARIATNVQRLSDRLDASDRRVAVLDAATRPWQQCWQMLCNSEDCWESWLSMLRSCSHHTKKALLAFFADGTGHALGPNDKVPQ